MSAPPRSPSSSCARPPRWDSRRRVETDTAEAETNEVSTHMASPSVDKVNLAQKLTLFSEHWSPKVVGELNGQHVRLAKLMGPFTWHHHEHEDELFLVIHGRLRMELRERTVEVEPGEFIIIPRGVEHRPVAEEEVHVLLFEPATTLNTGNVREERTADTMEKL
ncbi:cupin domain-containing protein [Myxococcus sp. CA040A]|uniref:Cupin domain-containing protein n=2 Tax=Myxococcaceae TaxID=31 RepID=A0A540X5I2_9BACT|nr:cupin domain-containing protein [Myxococcus sp. CA040A]NTX05856.1 cupin domain-containing protein [Myxococcus sp. CA040A]TQF16472.1 cupin domain-containing protein [Myxococcus llanfairpwllgwyngyllgogerychwyrndrobwllllantysiliogogogochensis]